MTLREKTQSWWNVDTLLAFRACSLTIAFLQYCYRLWINRVYLTEWHAHLCSLITRKGQNREGGGTRGRGSRRITFTYTLFLCVISFSTYTGFATQYALTKSRPAAILPFTAAVFCDRCIHVLSSVRIVVEPGWKSPPWLKRHNWTHHHNMPLFL